MKTFVVVIVSLLSIAAAFIGSIFAVYGYLDWLRDKENGE